MQTMIRTAMVTYTMEMLTRTFLLCFLPADCRMHSPSPSSQGRQSSPLFLSHLSLDSIGLIVPLQVSWGHWL